MKKWKILLPAAFISLCMLTGCSQITDLRVKHQLDIGNKYLVEFEYEKAMLAFSKVIQIEPKKISAYKGLAQVFTAQNNIDGSINVLEKGISVADGLTAEEKTTEIKGDIRAITNQVVVQLTDMGDDAYDREKYDKAIKYYEDLVIYNGEEASSYLKLSNVYETTGDLEEAIRILQDAGISHEDIQEQLNRITIKYEVKKEYEQLLGKLAALIKDNNGELGREALLSQDFLDLVAKLQEPLVLKQEGDQYIIIYPNGYVYMGGMEDKKRSGYGSFYTNNASRYVIYSGYWSDDMPNGEGRVDTVVYTILNSRSPNFYGSGSFVNGISEGAFNFALYYQDGSRYDYLFDNSLGVPPAIRREDGKNVVGYSNADGSHYYKMSDTSIFSVPMFEPLGYESVFIRDINIVN